MHDSEWNVRQATIQALGDRAQVSDLLPLLHDSNSDVRQAALQALGDKAQVSDLLPLLHDSDSYVRQAAIEVVQARMNIEDLLPFLGDTSQNVREAARKAIVSRNASILETWYDEAINVLHRKYDGITFGSVQRTNILQTLESIPTLARNMPAFLDECLRWQHYWQVRATAARLLGTIQRGLPDSLIAKLFDLYQHDPSATVRNEAEEALTKILEVDTFEDD